MSQEVRFLLPRWPWVLVKAFSRVPVEGELVECRERLFRVRHVLWTDEYSIEMRAVLDLEEAEAVVVGGAEKKATAADPGGEVDTAVARGGAYAGKPATFNR